MASQAGSQGAKVVKVTADGVISAVPCRLVGVLIRNGAAAISRALLYDNASAASGTEITTVAVNSATAEHVAHFNFGEEGINCQNGVYADLTGTTSLYAYIKV